MSTCKGYSGFACMECGHRFKTVSGAEKASSNGCPKCNSSDIDLEEIKPAGQPKK